MIFLFFFFFRELFSEKKLENQSSKEERKRLFSIVWRANVSEMRSEIKGRMYLRTSDVNCISGWHETIEFVICRCPRLNRFHVKSISLRRGKFVVWGWSIVLLSFPFSFASNLYNRSSSCRKKINLSAFYNSPSLFWFFV